MKKEGLCLSCDCIGGHDIECPEFRFQYARAVLAKICDNFCIEELNFDERLARFHLIDMCHSIAKQTSQFYKEEEIKIYGKI